MATYDLRTARLRATKIMPYMTKGVMSMVLVEAKGIGTMATDCHMRLYYDPVVMDQWSLDECSGVILHEMLHCLSKHDVRARARIGEKPDERKRLQWNIAADICINQTLREAGVKLPNGCMDEKKFGYPSNLSTEEYYNLLDAQVEQLSSDLRGAGSGESSGSMSDGVQREWEHGAPGTKDANGNEVPHGQSQYDRKRLERVVAGDIAEHSRKHGNMPGSLKRMADAILKPTFDPRKEILSEVKYAINCTKGFGSSTWKMPNRRTPPNGLRLPKNVCPMPKPLLIFDTSGSMNQTDLALCRGVLADVFKSLPCPDGVHVITGDTHIGSCKKAFSQAQVELVGGGGTDMGALMSFGIDKYPDCNPVIVVTDGYTPWPSKPLPQKCLALLTQPNMANTVPSWIRTVYIRPGDSE